MAALRLFEIRAKGSFSLPSAANVRERLRLHTHAGSGKFTLATIFANNVLTRVWEAGKLLVSHNETLS